MAGGRATTLLVFFVVGHKTEGVEEPCVSMRKAQAARVLQEFRLSLKGAGSVDQHLRAVFARSKGSCGGGRLLDEVVKASRTFLKSLGSLGRRERGPWCSHNFDLVWWEAQNLTGSLFRPWSYHIPFKRALKQAIAAMNACGLQRRFVPSEGTLIALLRYGKLAFDLGGVVDHVDKDIDMKIFVRSQAEFLLKLECIVSYLQGRSGKGWSWACSPPNYGTTLPEDNGEPWFFSCVLARRDGGLETFGSSVDVGFARFFIAGDSLRMALNCSKNSYCQKLRQEAGSVKEFLLPLGKCKAYDTELPCPKSPVSMMQRSQEHTNDFKGHIALPAVAVERCSFHSGTARLLQRGLELRQMLSLREEAHKLHHGGWASFYDFWFYPDGRMRPLPTERISADMRSGGEGRFSRSVPVSDPVHSFMTRFRGLAQVFAFSGLVQPKGRDQAYVNGVAYASGLADAGVSVEWILYYRPLVRHAAQAILQLTKSPLHLAALWELKPMEVCAAYFVDAALRCDATSARRQDHSYVESICKGWAKQEADVLSNSSAARDRSFLQLLWILTNACKGLPSIRQRGSQNDSRLSPFNDWLQSFHTLHSETGNNDATHHFFPGATPAEGAQPQPTAVLEDAEEAPNVTPDAPLQIDPDVLYRAHQIFMILTSSGVVAPAGTPEQGSILREEAIVQFVARHRRLAELRGFTAALPKIVFHWTQEKNFASIAREGLRVPDGAGVAIAHGSSFGNGIYVSPEFRYGKELFAYGARAAFMCLALPGKQHFGKPPADGTGFLSPEDDGYDSVIGREGQRGIDEWVFFRQDQLLLCFLVDELGLVVAKEAAFAAIKVLHQPWPQPPEKISQLPAPVQEIQAGRWQRRHALDAGAPTDEA
ncbi:unnamed protein product, partial [Symbiodinium necroappetens]